MPKPTFSPAEIMLRTDELFRAEKSLDLRDVIAQKMEDLRHFQAMDRIAAILMWGQKRFSPACQFSVRCIVFAPLFLFPMKTEIIAARNGAMIARGFPELKRSSNEPVGRTKGVGN